MINRLLLFVFLFVSSSLWGQQVLVDSISQALEEVATPEEKTDLLLGLCRAQLFLGGDKNVKKTIQETIEFTLERQDSIGYGSALCYKSQDLNGDVELGLALSKEAYGIGRRHQNLNLMLFGIYHIAEYYIYEKNDFVSGSRWLDIGHSLNHDEVTHKHRGNFYKVAAVNSQYLGKRDSAEYWHGRALEEFMAIGEDPNIVADLNRPSAQDWDQGEQNATQILIYLSRYSVQDRNFAKADSLLQVAFENCARWEAHDVTAWVHEEIGSLRQEEGRLSEAIIAFEKALSIYERFNDTKYYSSTCRQIGTLFMVLKDPTVAIQYYERGYQGAVQIRDTLEMIVIKTMQGQSHGDLRQFPVARKNFDEAISMARLLGDSLYLANTLATSGGVEIAAQNLDAAKSAYLKAYTIHREYNDIPSMVNESNALADIYLQLGQLDSTHAYLRRTEELTKDIGGLAAKPSISELLARVAEADGDYPAALAHQRRYQAYQESVFNEQAQQSLRSAQVRQNVADYQAEAEAAERESSLLAQRNQLYLALAGALLLLLLIGSVLFLKLRSARQQLAAQNLQLSNLNATKDRFFGIIAHDLRNPIVALQSADMQIEHYANRNDIGNVKKIAGLVGGTTRNLGRLLDNLLSWALSQQGVLPYRPETVNLGEITDEVIELFLPATLAKKIYLIADIHSGEIVFADRNSLHAILRNLVGNAIKFTPRGGQVRISIENKKEKVYLTVKDDGIGISSDKVADIFQPSMGSSFGTDGEKGTGLGLTLVKELTALNKGSISVDSSSGKGSAFTVVLPTQP